MPEEQVYPMRINKYLAKKNITTRRAADEFIKSGLVTINGKKAVLGDKVLETDEVEVSDKAFAGKKLVYLAYYKPRGIATHSSNEKEKDIKAILNFSQKVFPVGRLDKDSSGLIIVTNDGRITDKLLNPEFYHEKEYVVRVNKDITSSFLKHMREGVILDGGYQTRPAKAKELDDNLFSITLTEGKKHQIRRMCEALGRQVIELKRIRVMNVLLGNLRIGQYRKIEGEELRKFLISIGIKA